MTSTALDQAHQTHERATSTPELVKATQALCALNDLEAAKPLVKVLGFNNPAVAAVATQGLIQLGRDIIPILLVSLDARNYGARAWVVKETRGAGGIYGTVGRWEKKAISGFPNEWMRLFPEGNAEHS